MRGTLVRALAFATIVAGCYTGPASSHFVAVLDEFTVPHGWTVLATRIHGPEPDATIHCSPVTDGECPSAIRYFAISGDADAALASGEAMTGGAGFQVGREFGKPCSSVSGAWYCAFEAARKDAHVLVAVYGSSDEAGIPDADAEGLIAVVTAKT